MTVAVCLCDRGGMLFNGRRQSRDRVLLEHFMTLCGGSRVLISDFSTKLFDAYSDRVSVLPDPFRSAKDGDVVFVENLKLSSVVDRIDKMIVYRWNRTYPADFYLDTPPEECGLVLSESREFEGSSHEKITEEIWIRKA